MPSLRSEEDIAIIGMACLLPGAKDFSTFWSNVLAKRNFIQDAPESWCNGRYLPNSKDVDCIYTKAGGVAWRSWRDSIPWSLALFPTPSPPPSLITSWL